MEPLRDELEQKFMEAATKPAGPLDRAPELFALMAVPTTIYFFYTNQPDPNLLYALIVVFVFLSFVGGVITGGKPPSPPKAK